MPRMQFADNSSALYLRLSAFNDSKPCRKGLGSQSSSKTQADKACNVCPSSCGLEKTDVDSSTHAFEVDRDCDSSFKQTNKRPENSPCVGRALREDIHRKLTITKVSNYRMLFRPKVSGSVYRSDFYYKASEANTSNVSQLMVTNSGTQSAQVPFRCKPTCASSSHRICIMYTDSGKDFS